jgi:hypothetical protein
MGWLLGNGTPIDSAFLNTLMGILSTKKLKKDGEKYRVRNRSQLFKVENIRISTGLIYMMC